MYFSLFMHEKNPGEPEFLGTIEGESINLVAYDLLSAAKSELRKDSLEVEAEYERPEEIFPEGNVYDYSIRAITYDKEKNPVGGCVFGIKKLAS